MFVAVVQRSYQFILYHVIQAISDHANMQIVNLIKFVTERYAHDTYVQVYCQLLQVSLYIAPDFNGITVNSCCLTKYLRGRIGRSAGGGLFLGSRSHNSFLSWFWRFYVIRL